MPFLYPAREQFADTVSELFRLGGVAGPGGSFHTTYTKEYVPIIEVDDELYAQWQATMPEQGIAEGGGGGGADPVSPAPAPQDPGGASEGQTAAEGTGQGTSPAEAGSPASGPGTTPNAPAGTADADITPAAIDENAENVAEQTGGDTTQSDEAPGVGETTPPSKRTSTTRRK